MNQETQEQVFDLVVAGGRVIDRQPQGSTG